MIQIKVSDEIFVELWIDLDITTPEPVLIWRRKEDYGYMAQLVKDRIQVLLEEKVRTIRREAYNQGWKDAKSKKVTKETWFPSFL